MLVTPKVRSPSKAAKKGTSTSHAQAGEEAKRALSKKDDSAKDNAESALKEKGVSAQVLKKAAAKIILQLAHLLSSSEGPQLVRH